MKFLRFAASCLFIVASAAVSARAGCGFAECGFDRASLDPDKSRWLRFDYEFEYIDQNTLRNGGQQVPLRTQRGHHDEVRTINRLHRARVAGGLTERLSAELALPWVSRYHQHIHRHQGVDLNETWHLSDLGDLMLELRYDMFLPRETSGSRWTAIAGAEFPTGATRRVNEENDEADPPAQPGSESYDYFFGGGWARTFASGRGDLPFFATAVYRINGRGRRRYRQGDTILLNAGTVIPVASKLGAVAQLNFTSRQSDDKGDTSEEVGKTGGDSLFLTVGPQVALTSSLSWQAVAQLPLYYRVNRVQLTADYNLLSRLTYRFAF